MATTDFPGNWQSLRRILVKLGNWWATGFDKGQKSLV
jgi:hypothetical protein